MLPVKIQSVVETTNYPLKCSNPSRLKSLHALTGGKLTDDSVTFFRCQDVAKHLFPGLLKILFNKDVKYQQTINYKSGINEYEGWVDSAFFKNHNLDVQPTTTSRRVDDPYYGPELVSTTTFYLSFDDVLCFINSDETQRCLNLA
jgi:hypothetical protein